MNKYIYCYKLAIIGDITLISDDFSIIALEFGKLEFGKAEAHEFIVKKTIVMDNCFKELNEYVKGIKRNFNIKTLAIGTEFQQNVWLFLQKIPYGETISYKDVANSIGMPKAFRAVGNAVGKNPIPIIIPCHRVILNNGKIGGYSGGISIKRILMNIENIVI
jgi:methylated-DNA-[protein]-cysteine S-methyltransferase